MDQSKAELTDRWRRESREEEVARFRRHVRNDCRARGASKKEAREHWVPSRDLAEFNGHIEGRIELVHEFHHK